MNAMVRKFAYSALIFGLFVYAAGNWLTTIHELHRFYTNMWIWDPWDYLRHFADYKKFDLSVLWIQHNEHREIGTEVVYILDIFLFHGEQVLPEAAGIAAYLGALIIMVMVVWHEAEDEWSIAAAAILAAAIAGYKICAVSLNIPFLTSWPQWEFFGIAALAAVVLNKRRGGIRFLVLTVLSGIAATYSMSNGMLIWPLLVAAALLLRSGWRQTAAIAVCGAFSIGFYFFHYRNMHSSNLALVWQHPKFFAMFLGSFLGMPFSAAFHVSPAIILTSVCGWIALGMGALDLAWMNYKKLFSTAAAIVLGGFCLLVLASSVLTAVGRMNPADPTMVAARAGRYVTEPTLFWCALLLLTVWLMGTALRGYGAFVLLLIAAVLSAKTLRRSTEYYKWWENYFQRGQWAAIGLANGMTDKAVTDVLFPGPDYVAQFKHVLIDNRLGFFAQPEPQWIGLQANQIFSRGLDGYIHGEVTSVRKLGQDFEIQGWADGVDRVIFTDETGRILGFGMQPKAGPAELYTKDVPPNLAFAGFIRGEFRARQFSVWAVDRRGRKIYRMGQFWNALSY